MLKIPEEFSNNSIKKLDGFNAKIRGEKITELPAILIGQLGKNELYVDKLSGDTVMQYCLSTLFEWQIRLGGRIVMLECNNVSALITFYNRYGFRVIEKEYKPKERLQLIKVIQEDEIIEKI